MKHIVRSKKVLGFTYYKRVRKKETQVFTSSVSLDFAYPTLHFLKHYKNISAITRTGSSATNFAHKVFFNVIFSLVAEKKLDVLMYQDEIQYLFGIKGEKKVGFLFFEGRNKAKEKDFMSIVILKGIRKGDKIREEGLDLEILINKILNKFIGEHAMYANPYYALFSRLFKHVQLFQKKISKDTITTNNGFIDLNDELILKIDKEEKLLLNQFKKDANKDVNLSTLYKMLHVILEKEYISRAKDVLDNSEDNNDWFDFDYFY